MRLPGLVYAISTTTILRLAIAIGKNWLEKMIVDNFSVFGSLLNLSIVLHTKY